MSAADRDDRVVCRVSRRVKELMSTYVMTRALHSLAFSGKSARNLVSLGVDGDLEKRGSLASGGIRLLLEKGPSELTV